MDPAGPLLQSQAEEQRRPFQKFASRLIEKQQRRDRHSVLIASLVRVAVAALA
jgi:hypothetical protein